MMFALLTCAFYHSWIRNSCQVMLQQSLHQLAAVTDQDDSEAAAEKVKVDHSMCRHEGKGVRS